MTLQARSKSEMLLLIAREEVARGRTVLIATLNPETALARASQVVDNADVSIMRGDACRPNLVKCAPKS